MKRIFLILMAIVGGFFVSGMINKLTVLGPAESPKTMQPSSDSDAPTYVLQKGELVQVDVKQLADKAWETDKLLPSKDLKYNWVEIGVCIGFWEDFFRERSWKVNNDAFRDAYMAIARISEKRLRDRAFENSQQ